MKTLKIVILLIIIQVTLNAQVKRVAILDFENNSGNTSYDYLGKALSNMLITDLSNNIHPKNAIFIERNQLNKIINEQKLQNTSKFNQSTTVKIGKLFGSDYIFLGNVFVMNENCTFSARLVSTEQGKVLFSKEITGPINNFLILKTQLANLIAEELNYPIKINNEHNKNISSTLLKQYGAILTKIDEGKAEEAEKLRSALEETSPEFSYFSDLKEDLKKIISKVNELEDVVNNTTDFYKKGMESYNNKNYEKSIQILDALEKNKDDSEPYFYNRKMISYAVKAKIYYDKKDFIKTIDMAEKGLSIFPFYPQLNEILLLALAKQGKKNEVLERINFMENSISTNRILKVIDNYKKIKWIRNKGEKLFEDGIEDSENEDFFFGDQLNYNTDLDTKINIKKLLVKEGITLINYSITNSVYEIRNKIIDLNNYLVYSSEWMLKYYELMDLHISELIKITDSIKIANVLTDSTLSQISSTFGGDLSFDEKPKFGSKLSQIGIGNTLKIYMENVPVIFGNLLIKKIIISLLNNDIIIAKKIYSDLINDNVDENYGKWSMTFDNFQYILGSFNNRDKNILLTKTQMKNFIDDRIKKELATYKFNKDLIVKIQ